MKDYLEYIKENRKPNTYDRYSDLYRDYLKPYIGNTLLKDLKALQIEKMFQSIKKKKRSLSSSSLQGIYGVLNASLNKAVKWQIVNDNICRFIERPKREKFTANILSIDELNMLLDNLDKDIYGDYIFHLSLLLVIELGLRRGELAGLEWGNINFKKNIVEIKNNLVYTNTSVLMGTPKTEESQRQIYISNGLLTRLKHHKNVQNKNSLKYGEFYKTNNFNDKDYDFIFTWEDGKYIHPNYFTLKFNRLIKSLNINKKVRFHDIRHTNATLLLKSGVDFKIIQERLGHTDIRTTMNIYSHVTMEMQKDATEKLSNLFTYSEAKNK